MLAGAALGTSGVSLVANNTMGFVNIGRYEASGITGAGANTLPLTYARVAATFDLAGFDSAVGIQNFSGTSNVTNITAKATIIDGQMQGEVAGYTAGFYASYGRAPVSTAVGLNGGNLLNGNDQNIAKSTFNVAAELALIPHGTVQAAFRSASRQDLVTPTTSSKDNAFMVGATYELAQNMGLSLHYTTQSGSYWSNQSAAVVAPLAVVGKNATTLLLETAF